MEKKVKEMVEHIRTTTYCDVCGKEIDFTFGNSKYYCRFCKRDVCHDHVVYVDNDIVTGMDYGSDAPDKICSKCYHIVNSNPGIMGMIAAFRADQKILSEKESYTNKLLVTYLREVRDNESE